MNERRLAFIGRRLITWFLSTAAMAAGGVAVCKAGSLEYQRLSVTVLIAIMLAVTWNIIGGLAGLYSFAHAIFFGVGAYAGAIFARSHPSAPTVVPLLVGALAGTLAAICLIPCFRARTLYFAIMTVAITLGAQAAVAAYGPGGTTGLLVPIQAAPSPSGAVFFGIVGAAAATLVFRVIQTSTFGDGLRLIGVDDEAAVGVGVPARRLNVMGFIAGAPFVGFAGALFVSTVSYVDPTSAFDSGNSLNAILATLLGGIGTYVGPIIGAIAWVAGSYELHATIDNPGVVQMVNGAVLIVVIMFLPKGLIGLRSAFRRRQSAPDLRTASPSSAVRPTSLNSVSEGVSDDHDA